MKRVLIIATAAALAVAACGAFADSLPVCPFCGSNKQVEKLDSSDQITLGIEFEEGYMCRNPRCPIVYFLDGKWITEDERRDLVYEKRKKEQEKLLKEVRAEIKTEKTAKEQRLKSYGWTDKTIARVVEGYIYIGDTPEIVREAWGPPEDINRTITAYGTSEQWVYGSGCYVYFDNGEVTAIQD